MRPDIVAGYKIVVENIDLFDPSYLAADAKMITGVRDAAIVDIPEPNSFMLDVRFHGQTEQSRAEAVAQRILAMLVRDKTLEQVEYAGLLGHEEPEPGLTWTGRDPFEEITSRHDGQAWVRADYFIHALSFEDLGIGDPHLEHLIIQALQRHPQQVPARESVRRMREMYALVPQVRELAGIAVELEDIVEVEPTEELEPIGPVPTEAEEPAGAPA